jgi:hypothetical protein
MMSTATFSWQSVLFMVETGLTLGLALPYLGKTNKTWKDLLRKIHTVVIWL